MATGLPIKLMVIFLVGLLALGIMLIVLYFIPDVVEGQSAEAALNSCCSKFVLGGHCEDDSYDPYVNCTPVGPDISPEGWIYIEDLAAKAGHPGQEGVLAVCCKK